MVQDIPYEECRNPNLPWGYWLSAVGETGSGPPLVDEDGTEWASVRECFWVSRLGMARLAQGNAMHAELEFLLAVLVANDRRIIHTEERVLDLFGSWDRSRFYSAWLSAQGLVIRHPYASIDTEPSLEGRAAIVMLASTRLPEAVPLPVGVATLRAAHGLDPAANTPARDKVLRELEQFAARLDYRFERRQLGDANAIVLVGDALGPNLPLRRTLWSMNFPDLYARDRMYLWLQHRIDRWSAWGELAYRQGPRALSDHLLQVKFCDELVGFDQ